MSAVGKLGGEIFVPAGELAPDLEIESKELAECLDEILTPCWERPPICAELLLRWRKANWLVSVLIPPYSGELVDLRVPAGGMAEVKARGSRLPSTELSERSVCDLGLLGMGTFSHLDRFMGGDDYQ